MEKTKENRIAQIIDAIDGMQIMDAVDVLGDAINNCKTKHMCLVPIYYIGRLLEGSNARSGLVKINDDGSLSFTIAANGVKQDLF